MLLGVQGQNVERRTAAAYPLHAMADAAPQKSDNEPVLARPQPLILPSHPPSALTSEHAPGRHPYADPGPPSYEAAGSSSGTPMIERILIIRRDSTRETCIWLVPISSAISA